MTLVLMAVGMLAVVALALNMWQWRVASRFPLERRHAVPGEWPDVVVLKPLKGADASLRGCLETWVRQEYGGRVEVLFGVASADDPACDVVRGLQMAYPGVPAKLVVCGGGGGVNAKVGTLMRLVRESSAPVVVVSDADVAVPPDLVSELVCGLREPGVGLVNCLYRMAAPSTAALRCEAVAVNVDFWSQVLQSRVLGPMDFALGAVMGVRRDWLEKAGGFESVRDHLADDFQLGNRVFRAGGRVELCPVVVECHETARGWRQVWEHQLRWGRTIRVCRSWPYFLSILNNGTAWAVALAVAGGVCLAGVGAVRVLGVVGVAGAILCMAGRVAVGLAIQRRFVPEPSWRAPWWMIPVRDLLGAAVWAASFVGNRIVWRDKRYRVAPDGRLIEERASGI